MKTEKALGINKSLTQRSSPLHLVPAVGLLSMLFTHRHIHLLFIRNYLLSLILTPRVNEVGVRGRESGGLMDLIKGVALIISRETTRYGLSKEEKERKREARKGFGGGGQKICLCSQWQHALERMETEKPKKDRESMGKEMEETVELSQM